MEGRAEKRQYTQDEVTAIIRRALMHQDPEGLVNEEELEEIARHAGVSPEQLQHALREEAGQREVEQAKLKIQARKRREFVDHLRAYLIVNGALILMNLLTSWYPWSLWCILGWGIGLAFHASDVFFRNEEKLDKEARKHLRKEAWKNKLSDVSWWTGPETPWARYLKEQQHER